MTDFASRVTICQPTRHSFDDFGATGLVTPLVSTGAHQGNTPGALSFNVPVNFTGLFSKNEATPSLLSLYDMLLAPLPQPYKSRQNKDENSRLPPNPRQHPTIQQMRLLRTLLPPPNHFPHQIPRHRTHIPHHLLRNLHRPLHHALRRVHQLRK